jgi:hypothetical protein
MPLFSAFANTRLTSAGTATGTATGTASPFDLPDAWTKPAPV